MNSWCGCVTAKKSLRSTNPRTTKTGSKIKVTILEWVLTYFLKNSSFFCPQKVEKTTLKSCSEFLESTFFSYCPDYPNGPNRRIDVPKFCPIDQLCIELGKIS